MATPAIEPTVSEQDLEELDTLLHDLKEKANDANDRGALVMLDVYAELVKVVAPSVERLRARVEREDRAAINKKKKSLHKARRDAQAQQQQQQSA
jgi:hypothetical protein